MSLCIPVCEFSEMIMYSYIAATWSQQTDHIFPIESSICTKICMAVVCILEGLIVYTNSEGGYYCYMIMNSRQGAKN